MKNRIPNTKCKYCSKEIYKRPYEIEVHGLNLYCSRKCNNLDKTVFINCLSCDKLVRKKSRRKYCSRSCAGKATRNRLRTKAGIRNGKNKTLRRIDELKRAFNFDSCMVRGCTYSRVYHVHRLIYGKNGGKYEIGNMFAICPNHHAEIHAKLISVEKISDCELISKEIR